MAPARHSLSVTSAVKEGRPTSAIRICSNRVVAKASSTARRAAATRILASGSSVAAAARFSAPSPLSGRRRIFSLSLCSLSCSLFAFFGSFRRRNSDRLKAVSRNSPSSLLSSRPVIIPGSRSRPSSEYPTRNRTVSANKAARLDPVVALRYEQILSSERFIPRRYRQGAVPYPYSYLNASSGSIFVARCAGSQTAARATRLSRIGTEMKTSGSSVFTP